MTQYIDKTALVTEIEKRQKILDLDNPLGRGGMVELQALKDKINTLEVKEVNLDEEIEKCLKKHSMPAVGKKDFSEIATHFFELGLNVPKGETSECFNKDDFIRKVYEWLKGYAFVDDENNVHLPTLLHDFLKDSRTI